MLKRFREFVRQLKQERRELGWKGLFRKRGWRLVWLFIGFYLVRDVILYLLIPGALYLGITSSRSGEGEAPLPDSVMVDER